MAFRTGFRVISTLFRYSVLGAAIGVVGKSHITPVNGESMSPTLSPNVLETGQRDFLLWNPRRPADDLERGDLILFRCPSRPDATVVKRVIALGGDEVLLDPKRQPGGGKSFNELNPDGVAAATRWNSYGGRIVVPYGHVWVEGDNYRRTRDSNDYGPISKSLIIGKAWRALWPMKIFMEQPWKRYQSETRVKHGREVIPQFWLD